MICTDETTSGSRERALVLDMEDERVSARELIRRRVFQEVAEARARAAVGQYHGSVGRTKTEALLNGPRESRHPLRWMDPEEEYEAAVRMFEQNGFLLLAGERQLTELDEEIELVLGMEVTFLKLVPLVGG